MLSLSATKELYWRKDFKMGKLEKEVLEYTKKHKGITPGEIVQVSEFRGTQTGLCTRNKYYRYLICKWLRRPIGLLLGKRENQICR